MKTAMIGLMCIGLMLTRGAFAADPTNFEELKDYVAKKAGTYETYRMDLNMSANVQGMDMTYTGKIAGKGKQTKMDMDMDMMGQLMKMSMITDADNVLHMLVDGAGQKQAIKMDLNVLKDLAEEMGVPESMLNQNSMTGVGNPSEMLEQFDEYYDVEFKGKEKLDGEDVYVIGATINEETLKTMASNPTMAQGVAAMKVGTTVYVSAKDGFVRKTVQGAPDQPTVTMTFTNIELNPSIPDETFVFKAPEGMQVMDMTDMLRAQLGNL